MRRGKLRSKCTKTCARAFLEFRHQVITTPILSLLVESKDHPTLANTSENRLGCGLSQGHNDQELVVTTSAFKV